MDLGTLRARWRTRVDDRAEPSLWDDDEANGFLNEAVTEVAIRTHCFRDETTQRREIDSTGDDLRADDQRWCSVETDRLGDAIGARKQRVDFGATVLQIALQTGPVDLGFGSRCLDARAVEPRRRGHQGLVKGGMPALPLARDSRA